MITWSTGDTTGTPHFLFPTKSSSYEVDAYSFGDLWCVTLTTPKGFRIVTDYFRTKDEAHDFLEVVVNLLAVKHPDVVCSNFSFLTNGVTK